MRMAICIKPVPDTRAPIEINEKGSAILEEEAYYISNPADKVAVEEAVRIREKLGCGEVVLVSLGTAKAERALRECLTIGADRAILLLDPSYNGIDVSITAGLLAKALQTLEADLILCGSFAGDTQYGAVGPMIAEILGLPSVSNVDKMNVVEDKKAVEVYRKLEKGNREIIRCSLPAVVTVDQQANNPRYASLPVYMRALTLDIEKRDYSAVDFKLRKPELEMVSLSFPRPRLKKGLTIDSSLPAEERIKAMMAGGVSQRESNIIEGTPQDVGDRLAKYLASQKIV